LPGGVLQAMMAVTTDVGLLHNQLLELSLRDWAAAATQQIVNGHIAAAVRALYDRVVLGIRQTYGLLNKPGESHPSPCRVQQERAALLGLKAILTVGRGTVCCIKVASY